jgi:hypothetical protein
VPSGGDAYVLKHIVHDGDDANALQILRNVHAAMSGGEKFLVIEGVVPTTTANTCRKCSTWKCSSSRRAGNVRPTRTPTCRAAGFRNARVIPTAGPTSIVESEAA